MGVPRIGTLIDVGQRLVHCLGDGIGFSPEQILRQSFLVDLAPRFPRLTGQLLGLVEEFVRNRDSGFHTDSMTAPRPTFGTSHKCNCGADRTLFELSEAAEFPPRPYLSRLRLAYKLSLGISVNDTSRRPARSIRLPQDSLALAPPAQLWSLAFVFLIVWWLGQVTTDVVLPLRQRTLPCGGHGLRARRSDRGQHLHEAGFSADPASGPDLAHAAGCRRRVAPASDAWAMDRRPPILRSRRGRSPSSCSPSARSPWQGQRLGAGIWATPRWDGWRGPSSAGGCGGRALARQVAAMGSDARHLGIRRHSAMVVGDPSRSRPGTRQSSQVGARALRSMARRRQQTLNALDHVACSSRGRRKPCRSGGPPLQSRPRD